MYIEPLKRNEIISVIEGKGRASRIPNLVQLWVHPDSFKERKPQVDAILAKYPLDVQRFRFRMPDIFKAPDDDPEYRWVNHANPHEGENRGMDDVVAIDDWSKFDSILADFPNPEYTGIFPENPAPDGRYRLGQWFFCFFERHWSLRGMTNALMDFYTDPEKVHQLYSALCNFYLRVIERAVKERKVDGIFTSDDIGTQTGPFFSPEIFDEFFRPYYSRLISKCHELGIHFWLHTCGNIEPFIPKFIDIGLDVLHPIQKYTMDEKEIAKKYGKDICIWAGFDVQQIIPWGTPDEVRKEVRHLIDTYSRPEGRLMITAGNGINEDCPIESLEALIDETITYGSHVCQNKK